MVNSWDSTWETVHQSREWGKYPPEDLIRFVARHYYRVPNRRAVKLLEVGCGGGANLWYLAREGFDVYGIDGAPSAVEAAQKHLTAEGLQADIRVGDIIQLNSLYEPMMFDAVIDAACLQHNRLDSVREMLSQIYGLLKPGGRIFSQMTAQGAYGDSLGDLVEPGTYTNISAGPHVGMGLSHFFSLDEVESLFSAFAPLKLEQISRTFEGRTQHYTHWIVEGQRSAG